jgi:hypothetical protein
MYDYQMVESISERLKRYIKDAAESLNIKSDNILKETTNFIMEKATCGY